MSNYVVTCCSTCDMSLEFMQERKIPFAMFHYTLDGKEYPDDLGQTVSFDKFYQMIADGATPTTAQVNMDQYIAMFEPLLQEGKDILHLTLSSGLSGSYNSAVLAKNAMQEKYPERKIYVVDSLGASSGFGLLVTLADDMRLAGASIEEVRDWLEANRLNLHHWFFSTDLTSYYRGGRISKMSAVVGTALNICPLLDMNTEGKLTPRSRIRGKKKVMHEIVERMVEHAENGLNYSGKCYMSHSSFYPEARAIADEIESRFPNLDGKVLINNIGTTIGSHTGPGTIALFFLGDGRVE